MTKEEINSMDANKILEHIMDVLSNPTNIFNTGKNSDNDNENFNNETMSENVDNLKETMGVLIGRLNSIFATRNVANDSFYRNGELELVQDSLIEIEKDGKAIHFFPTMNMDTGEQSFVIGTPDESGKITYLFEGIDSIYNAIDNAEFPIPGHDNATIGETAYNEDEERKEFAPIYGTSETDLKRVDLKMDSIKSKINKRVAGDEVQDLIDSFIPCLEDSANYAQMLENNNTFSEINNFNKKYRKEETKYYDIENTIFLKMLIERIPELSEVKIMRSGDMSEEDRAKIKTVLESHGQEVEGKKVDLTNGIIDTVEAMQEYYTNDILNSEAVKDRVVTETLLVKIDPEFHKYMTSSIVLEEIMKRKNISVEDKVKKFNEYIKDFSKLDPSKMSEEEKTEYLKTKKLLGLDNHKYDEKNPPVNEKNIDNFSNSIFSNNKNIVTRIREMYPDDSNALSEKSKKMGDKDILTDFDEIFGENAHKGIDNNQSVFVAKAQLFMLNDVNGPAVSMMQTALNNFLPPSLKLDEKYINKPEKIAGMIEKNLNTITKNKTASNLAYALDYIGNPGDNFGTHEWYSEGVGGRKGSVIDGISKGFGMAKRAGSKAMTPPHNGDDVSAKFDSMYINNMFDLQQATNSDSSLKLENLLSQNLEFNFSGSDKPAHTYLKHYEGMKRSMGLEALQPARMKLKAILEKTRNGSGLSETDSKFMETIDPTFMLEEGEEDNDISYGQDSVQSMFKRFDDPSDAANQSSNANGNRQREFLSKYKSKFKNKDDIILKELELLKSAIGDVKNNLDNKVEETQEIVSDVSVNMDEPEAKVKASESEEELEAKVKASESEEELEAKVKASESEEEPEAKVKASESEEEPETKVKASEGEEEPEVEIEMSDIEAEPEVEITQTKLLENSEIVEENKEEQLLIEGPKTDVVIEETVFMLETPAAMTVRKSEERLLEKENAKKNEGKNSKK